MKTPTDNLVTLSTFESELEAQVIVNILEEHGIAAYATGGFTAAFRAEAPGEVRVLVMRDKLEAAKKVLAEHKQQRPPPDSEDDTESSEP